MNTEDNNSFAWEIIHDRNVLVYKLVRTILAIVVSMCMTIGGIVGGFIWYLNQYDFTSTEMTVEANTKGGGDASAVVNDEGQVIINGTGESKQENKK